MKKSDILKMAQARLEYGQYTYVCYAILGTKGCPGIMERDIDFLRNWVTKDLLEDKYSTVSGWLLENDFQLYIEFNTDFGHDVISEKNWKEYRIKWMDWMIEYWQKRGD